MNEESIAPCGMNCAICTNFLAEKHDICSKGRKLSYCSGCRTRNRQCGHIKKKCKPLLKGEYRFCFECPDFPCPVLEKLDERYARRFHMSEIENLRFIKERGMEEFLKNEMEKWRCPRCGGLRSCHNGLCYGCDLEVLLKRRNHLSWK